MIKILALGDSLTTGYGLAPENSFASRLEQALIQDGLEVRVINGGVSGDTAHDGLMRLNRLIRHNPDLVIVEFGANDIYMNLPIVQVRASLEKIIDICQLSGAGVLLTGVLSLLDLSDDYSMKFHKVFENLAQSKGVDFAPDFMPGIPGNPDLTLPDGIHPNESGVERIVEHILPVLRSMLSRI
jgi:acyl-CoA thioesterase I